ncbi:periplasmic heavy metal sensor [BEV proteobacterium]|nr:periplasmic heavy metal sensor [Candidatus Symbiopectobacterium sp. Chty_BC]
MLRCIKISLISLLMFGVVNASVADSDSAPLPGWHHPSDAALRNAISQRGLFDGVKLTEQQRQHFCDLMQQARQDAPVLHLNDIEKMDTLVTAEKFDEATVRKQISQMMQAQVERQIEMAHVRNKIYNLMNYEKK